MTTIIPTASTGVISALGAIAIMILGIGLAQALLHVPAINRSRAARFVCSRLFAFVNWFWFSWPAQWLAGLLTGPGNDLGLYENSASVAELFLRRNFVTKLLSCCSVVISILGMITLLILSIAVFRDLLSIPAVRRSRGACLLLERRHVACLTVSRRYVMSVTTTREEGMAVLAIALGLTNVSRIKEIKKLDALYVEIDTESAVNKSGTVTEIGIAVLNLRTISTDPGPHASKWMAQVKTYHIRIVEHADSTALGLTNLSSIKGVKRLDALYAKIDTESAVNKSGTVTEIGIAVLDLRTIPTDPGPHASKWMAQVKMCPRDGFGPYQRWQHQGHQPIGCCIDYSPGHAVI
ncbi:hypothetical protein K490DRAFT_54912 [Saccharata proteae CBS 121410]|uniref:Gfd2/YDR514C-like C-terminal domain-containing protein n=1 Tax=Saccharata proteae CBS 121410 TaxID=1314787 RepID=A0A6A5YD80_9PEZI|nr:hypothetical protein K490DRAFT_54912 [Saccharata proteae CBS 121410]